MIKSHLIKILTALFLLALGFLLCLFTVKSAKQEWQEIEARRLRQIERLNRLIEGMEENYYDVKDWNEKTEKPGEGK